MQALPVTSQSSSAPRRDEGPDPQDGRFGAALASLLPMQLAPAPQPPPVARETPKAPDPVDSGSRPEATRRTDSGQTSARATRPADPPKQAAPKASEAPSVQPPREGMEPKVPAAPEQAAAPPALPPESAQGPTQAAPAPEAAPLPPMPPLASAPAPAVSPQSIQEAPTLPGLPAPKVAIESENPLPAPKGDAATGPTLAPALAQVAASSQPLSADAAPKAEGTAIQTPMSLAPALEASRPEAAPALEATPQPTALPSVDPTPLHTTQASALDAPAPKVAPAPKAAAASPSLPGAAQASALATASAATDSDPNAQPGEAQVPPQTRLDRARLAVPVEEPASGEAAKAAQDRRSFGPDLSAAKADPLRIEAPKAELTKAPAPTFVRELTAALPQVAPVSAPTEVAKAANSPVVNQVEGTLRWMIKGPVPEARLQLHPESLGKVSIELKVQDGQVHAKVWVQDPAALQALQDGRASLELALKQSGLQLGSFDLQQGGDASRHAPEPHAQSASGPKAEGILRSARQEAPAVGGTRPANPRRIELYA